MASRLETLIQVFKANLDDSSVALAKGRRALQESAPLPRITHVALGGDITDTDLVGEGKIVSTEGAESRDRIVRVRVFNILMAVHGQNEEQAEQLLHNAIAAWESTASGSLSFSEEEWTDQQEGADGANRRGTEIRCTLTIRLPVYAHPKPLTRVSGWTDSDVFITQAMYDSANTYGASYKYSGGENVDCVGTPAPPVDDPLTDGGVTLTNSGVTLNNG